ncbi:MAG: helix-turn-helix transcriptional regulator [Labilithrix sp.]|nr:helix-turn-helix transcriptional regulator [Labilithrix sp.]
MPRGSGDIRALRAIEIVEAAYRLDGTEAEWLDAVLASARPDLDTGCGVYAFTGDESLPNLEASPAFVQQGLDAAFSERVLDVNRQAPRDVYDLLRPRPVTCGGLEQTLGADSPILKSFRALVKPTGVTDGFSLFARDAESGSVSVSAPSRSFVTLAPRVRGIWRRVGLHMASALRLRRKLAAHATERDALLDPSGKLHDASTPVAGDRLARATLVRAVAAMEQARSEAVRSSPERALALWQGLVAGEWSLVDQWETGGRRYLAAYRNRPEVRDPRALTPTECATLRYLAIGATNKEIEFALGLSAGTVTSAVTKVLKKLRVKRRVELAVLSDPSRMDRLDVELADRELGILAVDGRPRGANASALSAVELEVVSYVTRGWSNDRIASERQVSPRTIANQLRAVYAKLGITNRSQLARAVSDRARATDQSTPR